MLRDDFSSTTKIALASRAGYLCSMCKKLTIGPSDESKMAFNKTGIAAHIYGASKGHPSRRQNDSVSSEFKSSIENGIWLCSTHSILIDRDESIYTAHELFKVKSTHESYVKLLNSGIDVRSGILTKISISNLPWIGSNIEMNLSQKNVIIGANGVGKTMICEFIKSLNEREYLQRWTKRAIPANAFCDLHYFKKEEEKYTIKISRDEKIHYCLNDGHVPLLKPPLHIFFLKETLSEHWQTIDSEKSMSLLEVMASYFSLSKDELKNTIYSMQSSKKIFVKDVYIEDDNLIVHLGNRKGSFGSFSGGEKQSIMLDIILSIVTYYSKFSSTILLLDYGAIGNISSGGINNLLDICRDETMTFQLIFVLLIPIANFNLQGYTSYQLEGDRKSGIIAKLLAV